jgi:hypothetical protein
MVEASGNTPKKHHERGVIMAIAINNFPVAAVSRRNMASVYRRRRAMVSLALAALAVSVSFAMLDTSAAADRPTAENLATPKFVIAESGDTSSYEWRSNNNRATRSHSIIVALSSRLRRFQNRADDCE